MSNVVVSSAADAGLRAWMGLYYDEGGKDWVCSSTGKVVTYKRFTTAVLGGSVSTAWPRRCAFWTKPGWSTSQCTSTPRNCLCTTPGDVSAVSLPQLTDINARTSAWLGGLAVQTLLLGILVGLIPSYLLCLHRCYKRLRQPRHGKRSVVYVEPPRGADKSGSKEDEMALLEASKRAASSLKVRVSFLLRQVGFLLGSIGMCCWLSGDFFGADVTPVLGPGTAYLVLGGPGCLLMLLSVPPTDASLIRVLCCFFFGFNVFLCLFNLSITISVFSGAVAIPTFAAIGFPLIAVSSALPAGALSPTLQCAYCCQDRAWSPRGSLRRLWLTQRLWMFGIGLSSMTTPIGGVLVLSPDFLSRYPIAGLAVLLYASGFILSALVSTPSNRGRVVRWLGSLGKSDSKEQEAASVAGLIGSTSAAGALAQAQARFRALPLPSLTVAEMEHNKPDPAMHAKTVAAKLGEVSAFASHSWSDEGGVKYDKLHEYAEELGMAGDTKSNVLLWLDKVTAAAAAQ